MEHAFEEPEQVCVELDALQVEQVSGGVMVPLPGSPVVNWIIRKLVY